MFFFLFAQARYYLPETGRFISEDSYKGTLPDIQSQNRYIYCTNNPLKYIDPSGHFGNIRGYDPTSGHYKISGYTDPYNSFMDDMDRNWDSMVKETTKKIGTFYKEMAVNAPGVDTVNDVTVLLTGYDIGLEKQSRVWAVAGILLPVSGQTIKRGAIVVDKIPGVNKFRSEIARRVSEKLGKKGTKLRKCELEVKNKNIEVGTPNGKRKTDFIAGKDGINESIKNGQHVISKHVGKTDAELLERISSNKRILGASTFKDGKIANSVINSALTDSKNIEKINIWIANGAKGNLPILYNGKAVIGRGVQQGSKIVEDLKNAKIILKSNGNGGFDILTAYPSK